MSALTVVPQIVPLLQALPHASAPPAPLELEELLLDELEDEVEELLLEEVLEELEAPPAPLELVDELLDALDPVDDVDVLDEVVAPPVPPPAPEDDSGMPSSKPRMAEQPCPRTMAITQPPAMSSQER